MGRIDTHYAEVAEVYEHHFFCTTDGDFVRWYVGEVLTELNLLPEHRFVDIGGGTGNFTACLATRCGLLSRALNVEPYAEMLAKSPALLDREQTDAFSFATEKTGRVFDRLLLKEMVHHIEESSLQSTFDGLFEKCSPGGRMLIITRLSKGHEYPFFNAAVAEWEKHQLESGIYEQAVQRAGFTLVETKIKPYPCTISKAEWIRMVNQRFWSTFSHFTEDELAAGVAELEEKYEGVDELKFNENLVFIIADRIDRSER
jgi:2-polyprenyl-3-methyl-5-hydroxy-6-metoxy-1,4-benzoquinol methylase